MREDWRVTYEIVTPESAEDGEAAERGFITEGSTLRDALREACDYPHGGRASSADEWPVRAPRWFTWDKVNDGTRDYFEAGAEESRSLHIPERITTASRLRLARLCGLR